MALRTFENCCHLTQSTRDETWNCIIRNHTSICHSAALSSYHGLKNGGNARWVHSSACFCENLCRLSGKAANACVCYGMRWKSVRISASYCQTWLWSVSEFVWLSSHFNSAASCVFCCCAKALSNALSQPEATTKHQSLTSMFQQLTTPSLLKTMTVDSDSWEIVFVCVCNSGYFTV